MEPYVWVVDDSLEAPPTKEIARSEHRRKGGGGFWRKGRISEGFDLDDVLPKIGRVACRMIDEMASDERPFFLYVPLTAPHTPWLPDEEHRDRSKAGYYGDFVAMVDSVVGEIVDCLDEAGVSDETLIIFTSDNGAHWPVRDIDSFGHAANHTWRGQKADIHEGGHRVPFIVRWPGRVSPGSVSDETICHTDVFPTVLAAANIDLPAGAAPDGVNLMAVLEQDGAPTDQRDAIVHHSGDGMFAIRKGRWKLIEGRGSGGFTSPARMKPEEVEVAVQLYDLDADPSESRNVAVAHPAVVEELTMILEKIRRSEESVQRGE